MTIREIVFDAYGTVFNVDYVSEGCENEYPGQGKLISQKWRRRQLEHAWLLALMHRYADFLTVTRDALRITYKPDPRVYDLVVRNSNLSPKDEILFVSANEWDAAGSEAFGFKTVHINRVIQCPIKEWSELSADYEISDLNGLIQFSDS